MAFIRLTTMPHAGQLCVVSRKLSTQKGTHMSGQQPMRNMPAQESHAHAPGERSTRVMTDAWQLGHTHAAHWETGCVGWGRG